MITDALEAAKIAKAALEDKKAEDIKVLDLKGISNIADCFVIASGANVNQLRAMASNVEDDKDYQMQLKSLKEELARKIYLEKQVDKLVDDKAVEKLYKDYKASFKGEKEVKAKHILVKNEATAKEVINKLNRKGNFDKLAKEYSKEPAELGYFTKDLMVPEFAEAAFDLKKGEYTKSPVKTQFGYHVILVEDIRDAKPQPFDEVKPQLKSMLSQKAMADVIKGLQQRAKVVKYDMAGNELGK